MIKATYRLLEYFQKLENEGQFVEPHISGLRNCLKYLQKLEGDKIREKTEKELQKLKPALDILNHAEEIKRKYS